MNKNLIAIGAVCFLLVIGMALVIYDPGVSYSTETDIDWNPLSFYNTEELTEEERESVLPRSTSQVETTEENIEVYIMDSSRTENAEIKVEEVHYEESTITINIVMDSGIFADSEEDSIHRDRKKIIIPKDQFEQDLNHIEVNYDEQMGSTEEQLIPLD